MVDQQTNHSRFKSSQKSSFGAGHAKTLKLTENQRITAMLAADLDVPSTNSDHLKGHAEDIGAYLESKINQIVPQAKQAIHAPNAFRINSLKGSPTKAFKIAKNKKNGRNPTTAVSTSFLCLILKPIGKSIDFQGRAQWFTERDIIIQVCDLQLKTKNARSIYERPKS